ncbi:putative methanol dehydrogenase transcriptional regulatory protein MoxR2 [Mycobacterium xenopi 4042]|uniref:Putative methanol dehydrogenase transcriptional regulatory protein MoxR2 n=1 Tax=Mycobacterium xenopi 4042 TaxID=1299334 RepID=X8EYS9_MYCXE|nr:putative methanol dehydrogenase transcriptional regulatory protein MoxR2 [Mycobacterium xenopi 4042]
MFTNLMLADEINRTPPRRKPRCWRPWKSAKSAWMASPSHCRTRSSSPRRRTRSSTRAPTNCPRPSSTASCSSSMCRSAA